MIIIHIKKIYSIVKQEILNIYIPLVKTTAVLIYRYFLRLHLGLRLLSGLFIVLFMVFLLIPVNKPLFENDYSTVIKDQDGLLIGAYISNDEQWRFPLIKELPGKYEKSIITFEDKNFYFHPGIDPLAIIRAVYLNIKYKKIVSGGSTITMQVIRLSRKNKKRTMREKMVEAVLSLKLSAVYSKKTILKLYASHAPFGGNVVGIEAASWRYFGRNPGNLSWSESALLAVLPNSPSLLHPGKNREELKNKRNLLLKKLHLKKIISYDTYELAIEEPLPEIPHAIPQISPHLLIRAMQEGYKGKSLLTTIDNNLQVYTNSIIEKHGARLKGSKIYNACAIIIKNSTGEVLAYTGNTPGDIDSPHGNSCDLITAKRSPGSLLKPFLFAFMLDEGLILPKELVPDIPIVYRGFAPRNFSKSYDGAISVDRALMRSLNIPFVLLLDDYGYSKFYKRMTQLGMSFDKAPSHYSLSLILGSPETTLWDLTSFYSSLARILNNYNLTGKYSENDIHKNTYLKEDKNIKHAFSNSGLLNASSIWFTFEAMKHVVRPDEENKWQEFSSLKPIAWKTGTSYGNRDAWAIGITKDYTAGVWVGNADGEGRPEIKGVKVAGPILFDIFDALPGSEWFTKPSNDMVSVKICSKSGMIASPNCEETIMMEIPANGIRSRVCKYHRIVHLDENEEYQVDSSNYPVNKMKHKKWFVLPPIQEMYYKKKNASYKVLPPSLNENNNVMDLVYPSYQTKIFVPVELDGSPGKAVFELAHRRPGTIVYWHLDGYYIGETKDIHQMGFYPSPGKHELVLVDEEGNCLTRNFEVVSKNE